MFSMPMLDAFFIDNHLSTEPIFQPSFAKQDGKHKADPSVKAHGSLTIGYGAGGAPPQIFRLANGQEVGITYLKVFFTSRYVDLSWMKQGSPFEGSGREIFSSPFSPRDIWGTQQLAIVQRRSAGGA
jgi:hypothetical protein